MTSRYRILLTLLLLLGTNARPQDDNDCEIFGPCEESTPIEETEENDNCELFGGTNCDTDNNSGEDVNCLLFSQCDKEPIQPPLSECFNSINEIDDEVISGATRSVFQDCDVDNPRPCSEFASEGFACANAFNCNENNTIITDGKGLIDVRQADSGSFSLDVSDRKCPGQKICCRNPNFRVQPPPKLPEQTDEVFMEQKKGFEVCGRRTSGKITITGGDDDAAQPGEFPHMCVIFRKQKGSRVFIGGASLIARNKLLTVAHKFKVTQGSRDPVDLTNQASSFVVRCGDYNLKTKSDIYESQETEVEQIYIHPEYDEQKVFNNLAILRTKDNFIYQEHIGPVCLPRPDEAFDNEKGKNCWSSGWGSDRFTDGIFSDYMRKIQLGVVNRQECERRLQQTDRFRNINFKLDDSWMCIGGEEDVDTCTGDGGSPHVCQTRKGWTEVGAVAWGVECGHPVPSVYSSVPHAMCWIDWVMSCYGDAQNNIGALFTGLVDFRSPDQLPESVNGIAVDDCQGWMDDHPDLGDSCTVQYVDFDVRNN